VPCSNLTALSAGTALLRHQGRPPPRGAAQDARRARRTRDPEGQTEGGREDAARGQRARGPHCTRARASHSRRAREQTLFSYQLAMRCPSAPQRASTSVTMLTWAPAPAGAGHPQDSTGPPTRAGCEQHTRQRGRGLGQGRRPDWKRQGGGCRVAGATRPQSCRSRRPRRRPCPRCRRTAAGRAGWPPPARCRRL